MLAAGIEPTFARGGERGGVENKVMALCGEVLTDIHKHAQEFFASAVAEVTVADAAGAAAAKDVGTASAALNEARDTLD